MENAQITEHVAKKGDHHTFYLAAGPEDGPLLIFVHGWPELSHSWRHQLPVFAGLGFRAVAPDLRGYGGSRCYDKTSDYAQQPIVGDMLALLQHLDRQTAVWIGHDWGSPVVWNLASHHPEHCAGVASLCVPYYCLERGLDACLPLIDRSVYPEEQFPVGQWDYIKYYEENFSAATAGFDADPYKTCKLLFRKGNPSGSGQPAATAFIRKNGGWFGPGGKAPDMPRDGDVISEADLLRYAAALTANGFFGPDAFYVNMEANTAYAATAQNDGQLAMPVLFLAAAYDYVCETIRSDLAKPMKTKCDDLTVETIASGHWMAQEKPQEVNRALVRWLAQKLGDYWKP